MDKLTEQIAGYAAAARPGALLPEIADAAAVRLLDTLGCTLGGIDSEAARIGLELGAGAVPRKWPGRVIGRSERSTSETACFVNGAMARYLDFNDTGPGSHPSDCIAALLAVAEPAGASGARLLTALDVAYEVSIRLAFGTGFRQKGYDQGFALAVGTAAGVGNLLGLSAAQIGHAVAIAAVSNVPLRASRAGSLSYWKSAATPFHVKNGLTAALLAAGGMTGPDEPFEGRFGLWEQLTGPFELEPFPDVGGDYMLPPWSRLKFWPVEYNAQISVWAARALRDRIPAADLASVEIATYHQAWHEIASEPAKWDPQTRETADHSLPYIFARALLDGEITVASFDLDRVLDPAIRPLMARIKVSANEAYTKEFPTTVPVQVTATATDGRVEIIEMRNPLGHNLNPMSLSQVTDKFLSLATPKLGADRAEAAAHRWQTIAGEASLTEALDLLLTDRAPT